MLQLMEQRKAISFKGQNIYVGIDVHLKSWSVTILSETSVLKRMSQSADPDALHRFLTSYYPEAEYYSVYEAGFCGFWIHDRLTELGMHNIVVNPADVPTMGSEKLRKTDAVDSRKLAVSLRARQLKGIYTPDGEALEIRSLIRLKNSITKDMTRQKNRIKSQLRYLGGGDTGRVSRSPFQLVEAVPWMAQGGGHAHAERQAGPGHPDHAVRGPAQAEGRDDTEAPVVVP